MKKIISALTALVLTFTVFMGVIPVEAEETLTDKQASLENDIFVTGTNSFGALLSDELSGKINEQQQNNGCNIFSVEVTGNKADVSFETVESGTLLVAVYNESGEQMLASGHETVTTDETEKTVTIETDSMPKYFYLRAFLVDTNTLRPICTAYESPNYTKEMQEFFAKTVDDFDSDRVMNLDSDDTNNFAVFGENTKVIEHNGTVNQVVTDDEDNEYYVIKNADSSVTSLKKGDIFTYEYDDGTMLIVKVGSISVSGTTATIIGQDTDIDEVFDYVKIDSTKNEPSPQSENLQIDDYNSAYLPNNEYGAGALEGELKASCTRKTTFADKTLVGSENNNVKINGSVEFTLSGSVKYYISWTYAYLELKLDYSAKIGVEVSANVKGTKPIPLLFMGISPIPGVIIEMTPSFIVEVSAKVSVNATLSGTVGIGCDSETGKKSLNTTPKLLAEVKFEGTFFFGFSLEPKVKIISDKIAKASLTAKLGGEIKGTASASTSSSSDKHECKHCVNGDISGKFTLNASVTLGNKKEEEKKPFMTPEENDKLDKKAKWSFKLDLVNVTVKLFDWYYSVDHDKIGFGTCPYLTHKITVQVKDQDGNAVSGAEVYYYRTHEKIGTTNENGNLEVWLKSGDYNLWVTKTIGNLSGRKEFEVDEKAKTIVVKISKGNAGDVFFEIPDSIKPTEPYDPTLPTNPTSPTEPDPDISAESQRLSLGSNHSGYIDENGSLYMWGSNAHGRLGNGTRENSSTPIKIMDNVKAVSLGSAHSAAITNDGSLYMWGSSNFGQLGMGATFLCLIPQKIMDNVKAVSLGDNHSAAITNDGSLYMWGSNYHGELGNGTTEHSSTTPIKIMNNVKYVSLGLSYSGAITNDGGLYMWGDNWYGQLGNGTKVGSSTPIKIMDNVKAVSLGDNHSAAITNDGSLYMWGSNYHGELGNGTTEHSSTPIKIMDNVKAVSLGNWYSATITNDGSLYMWGGNSLGQLGNGEFGEDENGEWIYSSTPIKIIDNVKSISLGSGHSASIMEDGSLYMWGSNYHGELGNGTTEDSYTPIKITIPSSSSRAMPNTSYLANEPTEKAMMFTGLLPNEIYNFYSIANGRLLYVNQGISNENGYFGITYTPLMNDANAENFVKCMKKTDISGAEVTVPDILCNGEEQFAQPVVTLDGVTLSEADYDIAMQYSAVYPGEYDITIVGVGDYIGEVKAVYNVYCKHSFSNGKCTICKSLESTVGDVNEDGAVGVADIVALQKFLVRKKTAFPKNGDVNGDGAVNVFDVVKLKRILLNA